ncbi:MAG: selenocysteine-specific translation elongation factor [Gammaproteobacteria bacterium]
MIVGTAGHIDHGKTSLVKALTGVDTDRLQEEKTRGITVDLGYAYQPLGDGEVLGFVDVPGHERLIHNMLAGATGIDYVLLVIAADDGPMPQTREHLEILELLGLSQGAVALAKIDLAEPQRLAQVQAEIAALLAGTGLAGAPVFPVSARTGAGIDALRAHLHAAARTLAPRPDRGRFRLAIDRCFTLTGAGTVVTGTVHSGRVRVGDRLLLSPSGVEVRVRSIRAQNQPAETGGAGQRCALNLAGSDLERRGIHRGDWVVDPALHLPTQRLDGRLRVLPNAPRPLRHWTPVHVHLGAADITGRVAVLEGEAIAPGSEGFVQLVLDAPSVALHGDRFVLRDQSAQQTLGGGQVLDNAPPTRGRRRAERLALLRALTVDDPATALLEALRHAPNGLELERYVLLRNLDAGQRDRLRHHPEIHALDTPQGAVAFAPAAWETLKQDTLRTLTAEHARSPDRLGPDKERLRRLTRPAVGRPAFGVLISELAAAGAVKVTGPWVHLPEHRVTLAPTEERLWREQIKPMLAAQPFNPPRVRDVARALGMEEDRVRRLMQQLTGMGEVHRVAHDHYFTHEAVAELSAIVRELAGPDGAVAAAPFRDRIGIGRKVAIHILEFFDRIGYSRRIGDSHRVFRDTLLELGR